MQHDVAQVGERATAGGSSIGDQVGSQGGRHRPSWTAAAVQGSEAVLVRVPSHVLEADASPSALRREPLTVSTLPELISRMGMGRFQLVAVLVLLGFPLSEGADMLTINSLARALQREWGWTDLQAGGLASSSFVGLAVGTYCSGYIADLHGRRTAVLLSYSGMACIGAASSFATGFTACQSCVSLTASPPVSASQRLQPCSQRFRVCLAGSAPGVVLRGGRPQRGRAGERE